MASVHAPTVVLAMASAKMEFVAVFKADTEMIAP
jgi:hypothetical protein